MRRMLSMGGMVVALVCVAAGTGMGAEAKKAQPSGFFALTAPDLDGKSIPLSKFAGKVLLVVNTASRCGFTSQYEGLQRLQTKFEKQGFTVLGFPSNDFLSQEPGTNAEIRIFCEKNYQVTFPLFSKDRVKGAEKQAVYRYLTEQAPEELRGEVGWNFEKFLIGRDGKVLARFKSRTKPEDEEVIARITEALRAN